MSGSDGGKPAQTGLVDMGNISFYNEPQTTASGQPIPANQPTFTIADLSNYPRTFSEMVLNVTWAQLQPTQGGPIDYSAIDSALNTVATSGANIGVKLRVWGGFTAPEWVKTIDGPAMTITGKSIVDPNVVGPQTVAPNVAGPTPMGRWWTADYVAQWTSLQTALANRYDSNPLVHGMSQTAGMSASDEPFVPFKTNAPTTTDPNDTSTVNQVYA